MNALSTLGLSLVLSGTIAVSLQADATTVPAPIVSLKSQIITNQVIAFQPLYLKDSQTGEELLLAQHSRDVFGLRRMTIALYDTQGHERLNQSLATLTDPEAYSWISNARFNDSGDLIILHTISQRGPNGITSVTSHNLTKKTAVLLHSKTERASILGRVIERNRSLVAIENERSELFKQWDRKVDVVDEESGLIVRTLALADFERVRFGAGRDGRAKILVTGFEPKDWKSVDVASGVERAIQISAEEARGQTGDTKTILGDTLDLRSDSDLTLVDRAALFDGEIVRLKVFPVKSQFLGAEPYALVAEKTDRDLVIRDLKTNLQIGQTLPVTPAFPSRPAGTMLLNGLGYVESLLLTANNKIVVIEEPVTPNSYMPGSVLSYFNLETGKLLRRQRLELYKLAADLVEDEQGHVLTVERDIYNSHRKRATNLVVDLTAHQVLRKIDTDKINFYVMKSKSGRAVQASRNEQGQMCFADLKVPTAQTCVGLPTVALIGGLLNGEKQSTDPSTIRSGVLPVNDNYSTERGWAEFSVRWPARLRTLLGGRELRESRLPYEACPYQSLGKTLRRLFSRIWRSSLRARKAKCDIDRDDLRKRHSGSCLQGRCNRRFLIPLLGARDLQLFRSTDP